MRDRIFIDTNVLVHIANESSTFSAPLTNLLSTYRNTYDLWISRQVLREYAVVMSRPGILETPLAPDALVPDIMKWQQLFFIADENEFTTLNLQTLILAHQIKGKRIHDANIVATMIAYDIPNLLTLNIADFNKFEEIRLMEINL